MELLGCQPKVGGQCSGLFKLRSVIDSGLEGQGCDWSNTRDSHHAHVNLVLAYCALVPAIQFKKALKSNQPCVELRQHGMGQNLVHLDHRPFTESIAMLFVEVVNDHIVQSAFSPKEGS